MENERRRTEIWIETHEVKVIRFRGKQFPVRDEAGFTSAESGKPDIGNVLNGLKDGKLDAESGKLDAEKGF